jgi:hypothetical protein
MEKAALPRNVLELRIKGNPRKLTFKTFLEILEMPEIPEEKL